MNYFNPLTESRREFLLRSGNGLGAAALSTLLNPGLIGSASASEGGVYGGLPDLPHFPGKAKRVIYMFKGRSSPGVCQNVIFSSVQVSEFLVSGRSSLC